LAFGLALAALAVSVACDGLPSPPVAANAPPVAANTRAMIAIAVDGVKCCVIFAIVDDPFLMKMMKMKEKP
jgi:H+/gluconate symporter-like permease